MVAKHFVEHVEVVYYFYTTSTFNYSFHAVAPSRQEVNTWSCIVYKLYTVGFRSPQTIHDQVLTSCRLSSHSNTPSTTSTFNYMYSLSSSFTGRSRPVFFRYTADVFVSNNIQWSVGNSSLWGNAQSYTHPRFA